MAQPVKCLLHEYEELSLTTSTPIKGRCGPPTPNICNFSPGKKREARVKRQEDS